MDTELTFKEADEEEDEEIPNEVSESSGSVIKFNVQTIFKKTLSKEFESFHSDAPETPKTSSGHNSSEGSSTPKERTDLDIWIPPFSDETLKIKEGQPISHDGEEGLRTNLIKFKVKGADLIVGFKADVIAPA